MLSPAPTTVVMCCARVVMLLHHTTERRAAQAVLSAALPKPGVSCAAPCRAVLACAVLAYVLCADLELQALIIHAGGQCWVVAGDGRNNATVGVLTYMTQHSAARSDSAQHHKVCALLNGTNIQRVVLQQEPCALQQPLMLCASAVAYDQLLMLKQPYPVVSHTAALAAVGTSAACADTALAPSHQLMQQHPPPAQLLTIHIKHLERWSKVCEHAGKDTTRLNPDEGDGWLV